MQNLLIFTTGLIALTTGVAMWSIPAALIVTGAILMAAVVLVSFLPSPPQTKETKPQ